MYERTRHGLNRSRSRTRIAVISAFALLAGALSATTAGAAAAPAAPAAAPGCENVNTSTVTNNTPVRIPLDPGASSGLTTSTIQVNNAGSVLYDVDLFTNITHTFSGDLEMTLMSPSGTVVTITTRNAGGANDVFAGTTWDDDADPGNPVPYPGAPINIVTDHSYTTGVPVTTLVPEEALSAFSGENPNGTWTLTINDAAGGDTGDLNSWKLTFITQEAQESHTAEPRMVDTPNLAITDLTPVTSSMTVSNAGSKISNVEAILQIQHTKNDDLDISLTSPEGTTVTLTTDNGSGNGNFTGTTFSDQADPGSQVPYTTPPPVNIVTDHTFTNNVAAERLVPEEAMGAFRGENPNGTWTLRIVDDNPTENGTLNAWALDITTSVCDNEVSGLKVRSNKKLKSKKFFIVRVQVGEPAEIRVVGKAKGRKGGYRKFKNMTKAAKPGRYVTFKIRLSKKQTKSTRKSKGKAKVFVRVTDSYGNVKKIKRTYRYYR